jgi:shikimate kinase
MNIVLIGYRASGKSLIGKRLAERLGWSFLDVDRGINEKEDGRTIKQIYEESGEPYYRDVEAEIAKEMLVNDQCVIAFGGGTILRQETRDRVTPMTRIVYLKGSPDLLWQRSQGDPDDEKNRPSLLGGMGGKEEIVAMLEKRRAVYEGAADITIDASLDPDAIVTQMIELLKPGE